MNGNNLNNSQRVNKNNSNGKETIAIVSLILGIISLVLVFFISVFILPFSIAGLVLGIVSKSKGGMKIAGIVLNSISIFLVIIIIIFAFFVEEGVIKDFFSSIYKKIDYSISDNYIAGKYNCTGVDDKRNEYLVTLHLNEDKTFLFGPYGDLENNYAKGTYTYEDEHKTNNSGDYQYFMVTMTGNQEDFVTDGRPSDHGFNSKMEFGITSENAKKQGVIMFVSTYNMYYCYEQ